MKKFLGQVSLFLVAIIWGGSFVASAIALRYYSPFQIIALRFTTAFILAAVIFHRQIKDFSRTAFKGGGLVGLSLFLGIACQTIGLQFTTTSKNAFLTATSIIMVPFLSWFLLKRQVSKHAIAAAIITLAGIAFLSGDLRTGGFSLGDPISLLGAVFFALQVYFIDKYLDDVPTNHMVVIQMGIAAIFGWLAVLVRGEWQFDWSLGAISSILFLGPVCTLVAFGIQTWAQSFVESTQVAVILATEALFGSLGAILILDEPITQSLLVGAACIFVGIILVEVRPFRRRLR